MKYLLKRWNTNCTHKCMKTRAEQDADGLRPWPSQIGPKQAWRRQVTRDTRKKCDTQLETIMSNCDTFRGHVSHSNFISFASLLGYCRTAFLKRRSCLSSTRCQQFSFWWQVMSTKCPWAWNELSACKVPAGLDYQFTQSDILPRGFSEFYRGEPW